ncbi:MAG: NAD(P)H-dependent oxidoreductase [Croceibacterium sp.]
MSRTIKHAIIACHPAEHSFTLSVANKYAETVRAQGHEAVIRDLYRNNFDPVLREDERHGQAGADVTSEWALLGKSDTFVLVYPIWFGAPPAMLVGYVDRVFGAGRTRGSHGEAGPGQLLCGKHLVSLTSSGSMRAWLDEKGILSSLRTVYDRYLTDVFGFAETARYHFDGITPDLTEQDFNQHMFEVEKAARGVMSRLVPAWQPPGVK